MHAPVALTSLRTDERRRDIDGLRAIAVLPVVAFHIDHAWMPGGFLGVDIFFVISGYLISSLILRDLQAKTFSFAAFYGRRVRRILPALVVMVLVSCLFAWFLMDAGQLVDFGKSVVAQGLSGSNILFYLDAGYFDAPSMLKPLLHTWSLGVEEQFYLAFPLILWLAWRFGRRHLLWTLAALMVLSFGAAQYTRHIDSEAVFYRLPFRGWELLAGACIAYLDAAGVKPAARQLLPAVGLVAIIYSLVFLTSETATPLRSLPLVLGTCCILRWAPGSDSASALSLLPLRWIGLISYSLYLWHWPVMSFGRLAMGESLSGQTIAVLVVIMFAASVLSYWVVEKPCRDRKFINIRAFAPIAFVAWAVTTAAGVAMIYTGGVPQRLEYPPELEASFARSNWKAQCDNPASAKLINCEIGSTITGNAGFFVIGDSHAFASIKAFSIAAKTLDERAIASSQPGCPPLLGTEPIRDDSAGCVAMNNAMYEMAKTLHPKAIFLIARWNYYTVWGQEFRDIATGTHPKSTPERLAFLGEAMKRTVSAYSAIGAHVFFVGQVPMQDKMARELYKEAYKLPPYRRAFDLHDISISLDDHEKQQHDTNALMASIDGATFMDPTPIFCDDARCPVGEIGKSYYFDRDHLSEVGAVRLTDFVMKALK